MPGAGLFQRCCLCEYLPSIFRRTRFIWDYRGAARLLIKTMKYRPEPLLARAAGKELCVYFAKLFPSHDWDLIIPVPAADKSLRVRTFNQCLILARGLQHPVPKAERIPVDWRTLVHRGYRSAQAALTPERRIGNVRHAFGVKRSLAGKTILLIDDVITTGATSTAAGLELYAAGARAVDLLALARSPLWQTNRLRVYRFQEEELARRGMRLPPGALSTV
jgi:predicted amidophosphoribosyltransferase